MASYRKNEAREWASEKLRGVANVVIPSYTNDLKALNEAGIRHDIRKEIDPCPVEVSFYYQSQRRSSP